MRGELANGDRIALLGKSRDVLLNRSVEIDAAFFRKADERGRGQRFRDPVDSELRRRAHGNLTAHVRIAEPRRPHDPIVARDGDRRARVQLEDVREKRAGPLDRAPAGRGR